MTISDFVEATNAASDVSDLRRIMVAELEARGYEYAVYSHLSRYQESGDFNDLLLIVTYPEDWIERYAAKNYADVDPVAHTARHARRAFAWSTVAAADLQARQRRVMDECRAAGLCGGITVPLFGPRGDSALLSVAGPDPSLEDDAGALRVVASLAHQFHLVHEDLSQDEPVVPPFIGLSPREREVLTWSARGKSSWDIGEILDISERSVTFHVNNAMRKLDASSRVMAVLKAIRHGLITP